MLSSSPEKYSRNFTDYLASKAQMSTCHLYVGAARILTVILQLALLQKAEVSRPGENDVIQQLDAYD
jgi:hypothetical protein